MHPTRLFVVPHDILITIFLEYVEQGSSPLIISAVCRHWRHSALAISRLWLRISLQPETRCLPLASLEERLRTLTQRAGDYHSLEIIINPSLPNYRVAPTCRGRGALKLVHLLTRLLPPTRWHTLTLRHLSDACWTSVREALASSFSQLRSLIVHSRKFERVEEDQCRLLNTVILNSPVIQTVDLGAAWYQVPVSIPPSVTTLTSRMLDIEHHALLPRIQNLHLLCRVSASLEACPRLVQLSVGSSNLSDFRTKLAPPLEFLTIQHLQTKRLYSCRAAEELQKVHLPHLVSLKVKSGDPTALRLLHAPKLEELEILTSEVLRNSYEDQLSCLLGSKASNEKPTICPKRLTVRVAGAEHIIPQVIASHPQLEALTVYISSGQLDKLASVLEMLKETLTSSDGITAPRYCPHLKRLGIRLEWRRRDNNEMQAEVTGLINRRPGLADITCDWSDGVSRHFIAS